MRKPLTPSEVMDLRLRHQNDPSFSAVAETRRLRRNVETIRRALRGETHNHEVDAADAAKWLLPEREP